MKKFLPFTIGTIPSSYLDSLTYLEQILCINQKLCEIINYLQDFSIDNIENLVDEKINEIKEYIDSQDNLLYNNLKDYVDINLNNKVNELTILIYEKYEFLLNYIKNNDELILLKVEDEINELKNQIDDIIIKGINVYDPTSGKMNNIQDVVYNLYKYLRYLGIKAIDFDSLGLTVSEFENKELTAREFDLYSKNILQTDFLHNMYSPFNGKIEPISSIVNQLASLHKNEITCQEFDDLDFTCQEFDDKNLSAYDFDWNGKILLAS